MLSIWSKRPSGSTHFCEANGTYYQKLKKGWNHWTGTDWKRSMVVDLDKKLVRGFTKKPWHRSWIVERLIGAAILSGLIFSFWAWIVWT